MKTTFGTGAVRVEELSAMTGGRLILRGQSPTVTGLCTDSRESDGQTLFCAIRGERVDGHRFIPDVVKAGCPAVLCEHWTEADAAACPDLPAVLVVEDTVAAFGKLAEAWRTKIVPHIPITAVTGSVGKTTTKECIAAVLSTEKRVFKKEGNYNSTIGLPLSLTEMNGTFDAAVLEMGMSGRGEIHAMTTAARPDCAVITNIGTSHMELLGSRENIARAKLEIMDGLSPGGTLLINGDEPLLKHLGADFDGEHPIARKDIRIRRLSLAGAENADFTAAPEGIENGGMAFTFTARAGVLTDQPLSLRLWIPALGTHMVWAGAFAAAVGLLSGVSADHVRAGLAHYHPAAMRQNITKAGGVTVLEDCYNAAPESMRAAFEVLRTLPAQRRLAVLGDMRELGADSEALHRRVGHEVMENGIDELYVIGALGACIADGARDAGLSADHIHRVTEGAPYGTFAADLAAQLKEGDALLVKASRSLALETIAEAVLAHRRG